MAGQAQLSSHTSISISKIFDTMEYGPALEDESVVQAWLDDHDRKFGHFINNTWVYPDDRKTYETKDPCRGTVLASTIQGTQEDVNNAVIAAKEAFKSWNSLSGHARARYLYSIARHVQKHSRLLAVLESLDNGKTIRETRDCDVPLVARHLYYHAGWAQLMNSQMIGWKSIGVVGAIVPWNFPLMLLAWKVCPALAMGNTVVLKPATNTRLSALLFAEICAEAGLPAGVFNVITGGGAMGSMLATHPDVDKVGFTGSTEVGQILRKATAGTGKKISLELGGKSPIIVFDSADLDSAVEGVVDAIWFNQGQVCSAGSRLLVQEPVFDRFIEKVKQRMKTLRLGSSLDKTMDMGAIIDETQQKFIAEYVDDAQKGGAEVFQVDAPSGCYYPPTLITGVGTTSRTVVEEIFGPVLIAMPFRTAKEAISLANNTIYGLGASVFTEQMTLAIETAKMIKAGAVWINCHNMFDAAAGFGGYKQSGFGRDGGKEGLFEYVKPSWQSRLSFEAPEFDLKKFGASYMADRPSLNTATPQIVSADGILPQVDRTYKLYYGGAQKRPDANYCRVISDAKGKAFALVGESNRKDVRNAAEAASKAQPAWEKRTGFNRSQILFYWAENLEQRRQEFIDHLVALTSQSTETAAQEVDATVARLFHWAAFCDKYGGDVQETQLYGTVLKIHEPVGIIGVACPDIAPLLSFVSLVAPAVARGNAVVVVPSEKYPTVALSLYQVLETSDLPGGVINILTGSRDHITKYLTEHQDLQAVWYFGSLKGSKFVEYTSAVNIKRTWVNYGLDRNWSDPQEGQGEEFLYNATQAKNIWLTMGDIFAN
nr:aldehyde dehydrogenase family 16 member A1-like isoform X1 [Cherax quadricarinatus]